MIGIGSTANLLRRSPFFTAFSQTKRFAFSKPPKRSATRKASSTSLARFVALTAGIELDAWQLDLCARLESLTRTKGRRLLIHAPPQFGKSIIVSQRFPAWLLAQQPSHRIKLACYNITHATKFGRIIRGLINSTEYQGLFPSPDVKLPKLTSAGEWALAARRALRDSQPSFKALGLATGFVGEGADTLIIDDPYASPEDAYSETINSKVHSFWSDTAKPRLAEHTNVVVMFHRYQEYDLAGWLMEQEPTEWELVRYAAVADGQYRHPVTERLYDDPLGRKEGEKLSPRFTDKWLDSQQQNSFVWHGQFQGRPTAKGGLYFKSEWFEIVGAVPAGARRVRYWDKAGADEDAGDFTVGLMMSRDAKGIFYIEDVERGQWTAHPRNQKIKLVSELDRQKHGNTRIFIEQPPGLAKESTDTVIKELAGFPVYADPVHGDKVSRAEPLKAQCEAGNVKLVRGEWNRKFLDELTAFPAGRNDDQVDAASGAFKKLTDRPTFQEHEIII